VTTSGRTHCVVIVTLDGARWLCDPGFGHSLMHPILLEDGAEESHGGWPYRLLRLDSADTGPAWQLQRRRRSLPRFQRSQATESLRTAQRS
jgi:N-hydroxyarylamine O-acetyltransferase